MLKICTPGKILKFQMKFLANLNLKESVQREVTGVESRLKKIRVVKLYCRKDLFSKFKGSLAREEKKTGFNVLKTIKFNLLVEFAKSC